jgi:phage baseplate assembly protein W
LKTLLLSQGDLVIGPSGHATIQGSGKVRQDLALALGEELGHDRFHPEWGSVVTRFVGAPLTPETELAVYSEVARVLAQYIQSQKAGLQRDSINGVMSRYSTSDVVQQVLEINATVALDTIFISTVLQVASGETVTINRTVGL